MQEFFEIGWKTLFLPLPNRDPYRIEFRAYMSDIITMYKILQYRFAICEERKDLNEHFYHGYSAENWYRAYSLLRAFRHHHLP